ncbi:Tryptophan--tRNA ligase [Yarrowia sp. B02]|nr:Tryptophan--tRNA ligase [Yarrowia sp. B02]
MSTVVNAAASLSLALPKASTIFSMIQPTGVFHLGNYLGAVRGWADVAKANPDPSTDIYFGAADLHAITLPKDPKQLQEWRQDALASILAAGIDPDRCSVFFQSAIPEHTQLYWVLSQVIGMGYLNRMTQWKSKAGVSDSSSFLDESENLKHGLFSYPALQAADILMYKTTHCPVGEDQSQHLELTRAAAQSFNAVYSPKGKPFFPIPTTLFAPTKKIASLRDPSKKMSKSDPNKMASIFITESPDQIAKKFKSAVSDSDPAPFLYDPENRPGLANLMTIMAGVQRISVEDVEKNISHIKTFGELKKTVSDIVIEDLAPVRSEFDRLKTDRAYLDSIVNKGNIKARERASETLKQVYDLVGFGNATN